MKKMEGLLSITCLLTGIVIGFLISPAKGGFGNNSGNTTNYYDKKEDSENSEK